MPDDFSEFINAAAKRELPADMRTAASAMYTLYTAYVDAGFTKEQSLQIVLSIMRTTMLKNPDGT